MSRVFLNNDAIADQVGKKRDDEQITPAEDGVVLTTTEVETKVFAHFKIGQQVRSGTPKLEDDPQKLTDDVYKYAIHRKKPLETIFSLMEPAMVSRNLYKNLEGQLSATPDNIRHYPMLREVDDLEFPNGVEIEYQEYIKNNGEDDIDPLYRKTEIFLRRFGSPQLATMYNNVFGDKNIEFFQNLSEEEQRESLLSIFFNR
jgi:hypothetical protein